ncbi:LOW QUALITY PROTEIN: hypothetical protein TorRG33x02_016830 [Trema orientale]|uniref:Uncharacterized protein n=1 Tax=Trema orientale TaxID=63057 RepID=A0A2P5FY67_TREOI|nr:LOW QUALITY PROTEIN: hypothetical protein TorRG33x02_016830 [Trema orientale]
MLLVKNTRNPSTINNQRHLRTNQIPHPLFFSRGKKKSEYRHEPIIPTLPGRAPNGSRRLQGWSRRRGSDTGLAFGGTAFMNIVRLELEGEVKNAKLMHFLKVLFDSFFSGLLIV